jgi:lipopolysaccharide export system permease protein
MLGTLLQRMVFGQLMRVFSLSLIGLTGLFVIAGLVAEATQRGLAPSQILAVVPLLIPNTLPYTLPATTLFATCIVYGRLAADNEVLAVKTAGARIGKLLAPSLALGIGAALVTAVLYYRYIPLTHRILRTTVVGDVEDMLYAMLKRNGCLRHPKVLYSMWVREVQGRHLIDAVFKQRDEQGHYTVVARAREAEIHYDADTRTIKVEMPNCVVIGENNRGGGGVIGHQTYDVPLRDDMLASEYPNRASDMTWPELGARRMEIEADIVQLRHELIEPPVGEEILPDDHKMDLKRYRENTIRSRERDIRSIDAEWHQRPAIAFGCICFVLVGAPVGVWFSRADYLSAFVTCFLPTLFVYYPLLLCGTNLVKDGSLPPIIGVWGANCVTAGLAIAIRLFLLRR